MPRTRSAMKEFFAAFLSLLLAGCTWLAYNSKHVATFEQKEGWQVVEKSIDISGKEHEIVFAFHKHKCGEKIPGRGYVEIFYVDGERIASASFNLSDLVFPSTDTAGLHCDPIGYLNSKGRPLDFTLRGGTRTVTFRIGIHGFKSDEATSLDIWSASYSMIPYEELQKLRRERIVESSDPPRLD